MKSSLALSLISLTIIWLLAESGLYAYQYGVRNRSVDDFIHSPTYRDYFYLGTSFKPNSGGSWQGLPDLQINNFGIRGDDFNVAKSAGTYRILTFGGSTSHAGNYPDKLTKILNSKYREKFGKEVEIINLAVPAWNSTQSLIQLVTRGVYLQADLVLFFHAINDSTMSDNHWLHNLEEVNYRNYSGFIRQHSILYNILRKKFIILYHLVRK